VRPNWIWAASGIGDGGAGSWASGPATEQVSGKHFAGGREDGRGRHTNREPAPELKGGPALTGGPQLIVAIDVVLGLSLEANAA
jgi:hypothetical protein